MKQARRSVATLRCFDVLDRKEALRAVSFHLQAQFRQETRLGSVRVHDRALGKPPTRGNPFLRPDAHSPSTENKRWTHKPGELSICGWTWIAITLAGNGSTNHRRLVVNTARHMDSRPTNGYLAHEPALRTSQKNGRGGVGVTPPEWAPGAA